ncbi:sulfotransferase family protein [Palleronia aestuarii]|uniref:Sulfotransferase family protein n=1 Tax=Palleronia aestuarii TaxID=568105 RepID=A0A2W7N371_9RHOB|nr:sulfotransferase family 2 domain-containing protein [Palleronia aestuarii]PZX14905.1 sulfotransferase family protein [Palleronia aestuarii]
MATQYLPSCNALFLHVPKTAGFSISTALSEAFSDSEAHPVRGMTTLEGAAQQIGHRLGPDIFARTWSFCFVRNPWDWAVSGWLHVTRNKRVYGDTPPDFDQFLREGWDRGILRNPNPMKFETPVMFVAYHTQVTQEEHLAAGDGGPVPLAFHARFEQLQEDWTRICERLGREIALPHQNRSERRHYSEYYSDELRDIVARRNAGLIARFGYTFDA